MLRKYEAELSKIRTNEILPAAADCAAAADGVAELQRQLGVSQAEVAALRKNGGGGGGGGGDTAGLQAEVARLSQELRVVKMQAASGTSIFTSNPPVACEFWRHSDRVLVITATPAPTSSAAAPATVVGGGKMADLMAMRNSLATTLAKSNEAAEARAKGTGSRSTSPEFTVDESAPPAISPTVSAAGSDAGPALAAAQAEAKAAKESLAASTAQWEHEKGEWHEKEEKWKAETAQFKAGLGAEAQEAVSTLEAERTKWEQEQKDWQEKESQWAAESEQYKKGMGDEAKVILRTLLSFIGNVESVWNCPFSCLEKLSNIRSNRRPLTN